ncbi:ABC transporter type 1, transmembrane domain,ABC transporter-like,P-loop containing nucleoside triphosphate [Cinara cedri]|uniref:ABC transporter type 1, transmembrane domain,ABC transporter-like,P-loop containing nucleoside triphosphate n=1 Tax=Cinara cedri TaxID=506608 RepID=A0A5E4MNE2_9HEMI|nr:ABC transporter type 1, transmembrane domain,ABC transporter-like,P-loop containing nucleoside triphosphate [Cinara cedri]
MDRLLLNSNKVKQPQNPRKNANIFEILTFSWLINLFKMGLKKDLDKNDLYTPLEEHTSSLLGNELEKKWRIEQDISYKTNRRPSLLRVLIQMFGAKYMFCGSLIAFNELILKMAQPLCIGGLLSYFNSNSSNKTDFRQAFIWASGFLLGMFITSPIFHSSHLEILHCGMKMRVACCSVVYRKALRLSHIALGKITVGQVINLISNDLNRFDTALPEIQYLWIGPLQTIMITYFVWQKIGVSSLIGVATLFIFIPLQGWFGKKIAEFRLKTASLTDDRVRLMNEIILGIQVIKMYAWEKPFANLIKQVRKKEIQQIRGSLIIKIISRSFPDFQTKFQVFVMILSYVLLENYISVEKVYVVTSYYSLLRFTMGLFFSQAPSQLAELLISIKRIQNFLILIEKDSQMVKPVNELHSEPNELSILNNSDTKIDFQNSNNIGIVVSNATSSLLQAILGELPLSNGNISISGVVSYASQEPWILSGSILDNILFHSPMDKQRYKQVIKACALKNDLEHFPYGDRTIVGERGVTLSGGQRARINLARAIYRQADIYLLDDPLSAVDTRVGKHLFENCIKGYLKEKTCILVTHQIQFLTNVDHILLMENASIITAGSFNELKDSGFDFSKLLGFPEETTVESYIKCKNAIKISVDSCSNISRSEDSIKSLINGNTENPYEEEEIHSSGHVSKNVYISYFSSCGIFKTVFVLFIFTLCQVLITFEDFWISFWVNEEDVCRNENTTISLNSTLMFHNSLDQCNLSSDFRFIRIIVYTNITVAIILAILMRTAIFVSACTNASINLHNTMFNAITRTTMHFFHTNSLGRILNRFSKDVGAIDDSLPVILLYCVQGAMKVSGIIFAIGLVNIYLMIPSIVVIILFYYLSMFYSPTSRSVKRLEGIARSPIYGHLAASIQGLTTVRAHKTENFLIQEFDKHQDFHSSAWFVFISINQGFGFWSDYVCFIYISIVTLSFLFMDNYINGAYVGLIITQIIILASNVQWGIRQLVSLENEMTSVERIIEYSNSPQEPKLQSVQDKPLSNEWPSQGEIVFLNFGLQYSSDTPHVLKNLNFTIQSEKKVGIVGRTGAGKSSIIAALFRLAINEGNIFIDKIEIHSLGLHELRSKISIIPQEPILFSGTMRTNLDPFGEYPDHILWDALEKIELKKTIENLPGGLNTKMSESGSNFSVGQRQLVCLARAIIRNNKILVLDEATANVDLQTDALIQNTIRNHFKTCTVLTIAHRLNTVIDSDKIIVMEAGRMVEFDHSYNLLKNKDGYFYKMVEQAGQSTANSLKRIAAESYKSIKTKLLV